MKKLSMILTVLFIFGSSAIGHTSEKCILFEGTFEQSARRPVAQFEYFQALDGKAVLQVYTNKDRHHHPNVDSAMIAINGKKVVRSWDFYKKRFFRFWHFRKHKFYHSANVRQNNDIIEKTVELTTGRNSLEVMLEGRRGSKINVVIVGTKPLASKDSDGDLISDDGDESGISTDNPCTGGNTALCDDNCPNDFNPDQADSDGDKIGDVCDAGDTYPNTVIGTIPVGTKPYGGIALSPDGQFAYATNYGDGTVSVIKTADKTVMDTISVGPQPFGVAMSPNGDYAYVSNYGSNSISIIRTSDNSVEGPFPAGQGPFGISMTHDGMYAYVNDYGTGTVSVLDTSDNSIADTITVANGPFGIAVAPDDKHVYVCNFGSDTVSVIQTSDNSVTQSIQVGDGPSGVAVTPNGRYAYVTNFFENSVSVIQTSDDPEGNTVFATIRDVGNAGNWIDGVAVTPNGAFVYVNNYTDNTVSVIRTYDNSVIDTINVGTKPHGGIAVSPDGNFVYVGNYTDGTVSIIGYEF
ncbi:MAG: YncE family protein [Desulfobacterales bacterium]